MKNRRIKIYKLKDICPRRRLVYAALAGLYIITISIRPLWLND